MYESITTVSSFYKHILLFILLHNWYSFRYHRSNRAIIHALVVLTCQSSSNRPEYCKTGSPRLAEYWHYGAPGVQNKNKTFHFTFVKCIFAQFALLTGIWNNIIETKRVLIARVLLGQKKISRAYNIKLDVKITFYTSVGKLCLPCKVRSNEQSK